MPSAEIKTIKRYQRKLFLKLINQMIRFFRMGAACVVFIGTKNEDRRTSMEQNEGNKILNCRIRIVCNCNRLIRFFFYSIRNHNKCSNREENHESRK